MKMFSFWDKLNFAFAGKIKAVTN